MIDFKEFCPNKTCQANVNHPQDSQISTLLREHHKSFTSLPFWDIKMFLLDPPKQCNSLA